MRLLALVTDGFGASGSIARYNLDLMTALAQSPRVSKIDLLPRFGAAAAAVPAKVRQLAPHPGRAVWSARALALAAEHRFDAVFCGYLDAAPLAAAIAGLRRVPLWVQAHGIESERRPGAVRRRALAAAVLVTSASRHARARLLAWTDLAPHRVRVLPGLLDTGDPAVHEFDAGDPGTGDAPRRADRLGPDVAMPGVGDGIADAQAAAGIAAAMAEAGRQPDAAEAAQRLAFPRFAAHVDALVATLVR